MPTYEYVCAKCKHHFEKFQRMTEKPLTVCPKDLCPRKVWGKGKVKHAVTAGAGLIFKGSGFYITDYRSEGYKADAKTDSGGSSSAKKESSGASGASSDSAKKETKGSSSSGEKASGSSPPASSDSKPAKPA